MKTNRSEKGQAFVLIIVAIVAIFGFAALAVDGGNVYAERRRAQNAADASALAAASAKQQEDPNWKQTALNLAAANGFNNDGTSNTIYINNPPASGPYKDKTEYFQVVIDTKVAPIFSQFIYTGAQKQSVESVVRYKPVEPGSSGNAIWGVKKNDESVTFNGATGLLVEGGNIFSNGWGDKTGSSEAEDAGIDVTGGGKILSVMPWEKSEDVSPSPQLATEPMPVPNFPKPYCPTIAESPKLVDVEINGVDKQIKFYHWAAGALNAKNVELQSNSVHCVDGDIDFHGGGSLTGERVLLVMLSGGITSNGNSTTDLTHMESLVINGVQYGGMLIWSGSDHEIVLGGTNDSNLTGTIYAPKATCDIGGSDEANAFYSAFICSDIKFHGSTKIHIIYNAAQQAHSPSYFNQTQ